MDAIFKVGLPALLLLVLPGWLYTTCKRWVIQEEQPKMEFAEYIRIIVRSIFIISFVTAVFEVFASAQIGTTFYGEINQAIFGDDIKAMFKTGSDAICSMCFLVAFPIVLGLLSGMLHGIGISAEKLRQNLALPALGSKDQAWDQAFGVASKSKLPILVEVDTKKQKFYGLYGKNSCVSRSGGYRDVYIDQLWLVDTATGNLAPDPLGSKMLIKGNLIETVRFFPVP